MTAQEIKEFCKNIGITQKELAEKVGMSQEGLNSILSTGKISKTLEASINLLMENEKLRQELKNYENLKNSLKQALS
ncbi:helix-turn-helix domain-containing protein [Campylobacter jejuni]|uniref:Helix-turn-helix domain-containing protein n=1 Tax=Campylobacter jejuni TaxID=197 RepID=A0A690V0Y8_CAMJU|nr:helix-turn-helix domain-containing protein [Campylobacter jejuni]EAJ5194302.1 helix-turn-helix domain-containing protein [Campylobacter jejuni]EAK0574313.1 helix-turn-helix domain-containing protein [Campylobacter jejuni]EDP8234650.1 helix-turn-helix domain-containing protein [Campylobacter jejuni]EGN0264627.1 helix-turn-helix domain-containing protein [Campylobacter jejuni]EKL1316256.1 helix-turn-helix domain-containing protein [Campylobacter jejuni]